jgi:hypothetical protein
MKKRENEEVGIVDSQMQKREKQVGHTCEAEA